MNTIDPIIRFVRWICSKLTRDELVSAVRVLQEVINGERDDIRPRNDFQEKHPNYRKFSVDPEQPLTEAPPLPAPEPTLDYRVLLAEHRAATGKELKPVRRRQGSHVPPAGAKCERCSAPRRFLYVNDGKKASQLRCKVCDLLFPSHRCRRESDAKYWCPHCSWALYRWKHNQNITSYKCPNDDCPCYRRNFERLNEPEKKLTKTDMSSQFKLRYQYREYHLQPAQLQTVKPDADTVDLNRIRKHMSVVGYVLSYAVSFGLSSRTTAEVLRRMHGIHISHQCVLNYVQAAAVLAQQFIDKHLGPLRDEQLAGDETYIRVGGEWQYTWFIIGAESRAIRAYHVSEQRDAIAATATLNAAVEKLPYVPKLPLDFIADGNPSYDAAVHIINSEFDGTPLARKKVIGLVNEDDESTQYRVFKQLIERLNRTYKFHTRARSGFKNQQGAVALTTLFVAYYNFLRPHRTLRYNVPIDVPELQAPKMLQAQWLKLLEMAS